MLFKRLQTFFNEQKNGLTPNAHYDLIIITGHGSVAARSLEAAKMFNNLYVQQVFYGLHLVIIYNCKLKVKNNKLTENFYLLSGYVRLGSISK